MSHARRSAAQSGPPQGGRQSPAPRSASPFLVALEGRAAAGRPAAATPSPAAIPPPHGSPTPTDAFRTQAAARRHQQVSTAARLQALISRANRIASGSGGGRGTTGSTATRRPASALQQRRPPVLTEAQRAASAMALREQLHAEQQHGAGPVAPDTRPGQQAGSRLGRLPGVPLQPAPDTAKLGGRAMPAAGGQPAASRAGLGVAGGRLTPPPQPGSAGATKQPAGPQPLPALPLGRPPSRMQHYEGGQQHKSAPAAALPSGTSSQPMKQQQQQQWKQAMAPLRPLSAAPQAAGPLRRSVSLGSSGSSAAMDRAAADAAELFAVTREARSHSVAQQQAAAAEQQVLVLTQQLEQAQGQDELQAATASATSWLAQQLPQPAAQLLTQLMAALQAAGSGSSSHALTRPGAATALGPAAPPAGSLRPHQLFQQCGQLRGEKAALERLNGELSSQVTAYQEQLASLHLRVDNLLQERRRLQEEAAEQEAAAAAAQQRWEADVQSLRQQLAAAQQASAAAASSQREGSAADTASAAGGGRPSLHSDESNGAQDSGRPVTELPSEEVTWGRTLTGRAPAPRPKAVPPVDLSRLRLRLPAVAG